MKIKSNTDKVKILIFGACGQIGKFLVNELLNESNFEVIGVSNNSEFTEGEYKLYYGDMTSDFSIRSILDMVRPDVIVNLAALSMPDACEARRREALQINVEGVLNVLQIASKLNPNIIFLNMGSVHELNPDKNNDFYTITKKMARSIIDMYREKLGIKAYQIYLCLNDSEYRNTYNMNFFKRIIQHMTTARKGSTFSLCNFTRKKYYSYSGDVAIQILNIVKLLLKNNCDKRFVKHGKIAILGNRYSIKDFVETAMDRQGFNWILKNDGYYVDGMKMFALEQDCEFKDEPIINDSIFYIRKANKSSLKRIVNSLFAPNF